MLATKTLSLEFVLSLSEYFPSSYNCRWLNCALIWFTPLPQFTLERLSCSMYAQSIASYHRATNHVHFYVFIQSRLSIINSVLPAFSSRAAFCRIFSCIAFACLAFLVVAGADCYYYCVDCLLLMSKLLNLRQRLRWLVVGEAREDRSNWVHSEQLRRSWWQQSWNTGVCQSTASCP